MGLELETLHGSLLLLEDELALTLVHLRCQVGILLLHTEVVFNQVEGLLVDFLVLMALQELYLIQTCTHTHTHIISSYIHTALHTVLVYSRME